MNLHSFPPDRDGLLLGIDVGGTDVKIGLVDCNGTLHLSHRTSTPELGTPERVFEYALEFARSQLPQVKPGHQQLAGVGLAVPGVLDSRAFVLREVVNLPGWLDVPLLERLSDLSKLPSAVINDANSAALAEHAIRKLGDKSLALVTLGTGIGCGVVVGGEPYGGDHGCAGELGHIAIDFGDDALPCTCGSRGHLESYAGAAGVIRRFRATWERGEFDASANGMAVRPDPARATPRDLAFAAEAGDPACLHVLHETARYVGRAIGLLGQVIDPEVVLLGGAMTFGGPNSTSGQAFLRTVRATVRETTLVQVGGNIHIDFATLGNDAGMLGAAMAAMRASEPGMTKPKAS